MIWAYRIESPAYGWVELSSFDLALELLGKLEDADLFAIDSMRTKVRIWDGLKDRWDTI